jgi:hypothetical protein
MGDDSGITISGGGSIEVGTDSLFSAAALLHAAELELTDELRELASIERLVSMRSVGFVGLAPSLSAEWEMGAASLALSNARSAAGAMSTALHQTAAAYGEAERLAGAAARVAAAGMAYQLGRELSPLTPLMISLGRWLAPTVLGSGLDSAGSGLTSPLKFLVGTAAFTSVVRLAAMSADEFGTGALGLPFSSDPAYKTPGDQGLPTSIAALRDLARADDELEETPIVTTRTSSDIAPQGVPTGWADRASRIPEKNTSDQVRIDTYEMPDGSKRYEVYIGGTRDFGLGPDDQPWDMTSNLVGIEGDQSGSMRAVENAMRESGITSDSPVLLTGHSQGGLVAASIAQSGDYDVQGLFTLGAPAAQSDVPDGIPWVALEHSNDIVPALSGDWAHSDPVIVTRYVGPVELAEDPHFFAAHLLPEYERTAALADASGDSRVGAVAGSFDDFTTGATPILSETYTSVREKGD